nr:hypothetical protein [Nocardia elegans]
MTWHNDFHDRTWSTTRGAPPCRLQARLQRQLSAGSPPVARPPLSPIPGIRRDAHRSDSLNSEGASQPLPPAARPDPSSSGATL